jgi:hypothetical protein
MNNESQGIASGINLKFEGNPLEWLEQSVTFPHSARSTAFSHKIAPWWNQIIRDYADPHVRQIVVQACTGAGKSTLLESLSCWIVAHDPGPTLAITQTDQTSKEWLETRLSPVFHACDPVRKLMPANRHHVRKDAILFPHMPFLMGGANVSNAQEKSVRHLLLDEAWTYSDLIGQFKARHHDRFDRKTLIVSQSWESPHALDDEYQSGQRFYWAYKCVSCRELVRPEFVNIKYDEAKNTDGEWQWGEVMASVRHECPHCQHTLQDNATGRRTLCDNSTWYAEDGDHMGAHRSYHVPAQAVWWIRWADLVVQWLRANDAKHVGMLEPLKDFRMKRQAQPWKAVEELPKIDLEASDYTAAGMEGGQQIPDEFDRMMTIDVQQDHYWAVIRAWTKEGTSRLVFAGKVLTETALREIQTRHKVNDRRTFMDAGNSFHGTVYDRCAKFGWLALIGRGQDNFLVREPKTGKTYRRLYNDWDKVIAPTTRGPDGKRLWVLFSYWASDPIKDILARLRNIGAPTWEFPKDVAEEYVKHLNSEVKRDTVDKATKRTRKRWTFVGRPNHLWDCEAMQVCAALMLKILPDIHEVELDEETQPVAD